jgi:hypothetical protein
MIMTVCPIAIVAGCQKCPAFKICPLKSVLGDQPGAAEQDAKSSSTAAQEKNGKK